jgi:hypothetical protein
VEAPVQVETIELRYPGLQGVERQQEASELKWHAVGCLSMFAKRCSRPPSRASVHMAGGCTRVDRALRSHSYSLLPPRQWFIHHFCESLAMWAWVRLGWLAFQVYATYVYDSQATVPWFLPDGTPTMVRHAMNDRDQQATREDRCRCCGKIRHRSAHPRHRPDEAGRRTCLKLESASWRPPRWRLGGARNGRFPHAVGGFRAGGVNGGCGARRVPGSEICVRMRMRRLWLVTLPRKRAKLPQLPLGQGLGSCRAASSMREDYVSSLCRHGVMRNVRDSPIAAPRLCSAICPSQRRPFAFAYFLVPPIWARIEEQGGGFCHRSAVATS